MLTVLSLNSTGHFVSGTNPLADARGYNPVRQGGDSAIRSASNEVAGTAYQVRRSSLEKNLVPVARPFSGFLRAWWRELQLAAERFSLGLLDDFLPN
jgi:hypothetical protein